MTSQIITKISPDSIVSEIAINTRISADTGLDQISQLRRIHNEVQNSLIILAMENQDVFQMTPIVVTNFAKLQNEGYTKTIALQNKISELRVQMTKELKLKKTLANLVSKSTKSQSSFDLRKQIKKIKQQLNHVVAKKYIIKF